MDFPRVQRRIEWIEDQLAALDNMLENRDMDRTSFDSYQWQYRRYEEELAELKTLVSTAIRCRQTKLSPTQLYLVVAVSVLSMALSLAATYGLIS